MTAHELQPQTTKHRRDLADGRLVGVHALGLALLGRRHGRRSTAAAAALARRLQPGQGSVADQVALELGQRPEQVEHQPSTRGRRVDRLLERPEPDAPLVEVAQRPTEAVEPPDDQDVPGSSCSSTATSCDRSTRKPEATSTHSWAQPAAVSASRCSAGSCSAVDTRA